MTVASYFAQFLGKQFVTLGYPVNFQETGFNQGTNWCVTFNTQYQCSASASMTFNALPASYSYAIANLDCGLGCQYVIATNPSSPLPTAYGVTTVSVTATKQYQVTLAVYPTGGGTAGVSVSQGSCGTNCYWENAGSGVTVNEAKGQNDHFQSWSSTGSITLSCTSYTCVTSLATINGLGTITANFATTTIAISLSSSSIIAGQSIYVTSTLSGQTSGAGGSVTYYYYQGSSSCSGTAYQLGAVKSVTNGVPQPSDSHTFSSVNTYSINAVYTPDSYNNGNTSTCRVLQVSQGSAVFSSNLPSSVNWCVTITGYVSTPSCSQPGTQSYAFFLNAGTYTYHVTTPATCGSGCQWVTTSQGSVTVNSATTPVPIAFTHQYYLTMSCTTCLGTLKNYVTPSSAWHNAGSTVTITAYAFSPYYLVHWTGQCTYSTECTSPYGYYSGTSYSATVTMNNPISENALFSSANTPVIGVNSPIVVLLSGLGACVQIATSEHSGSDKEGRSRTRSQN